LALEIRSGVIAATLALRSGRDTIPLQTDLYVPPERENAILFGASDLLVMADMKTGFDDADAFLGATGRALNWYSAVSLGHIYGDNEPRLFRGLSFLRFHRPQYESLTLAQLDSLLSQFRRISELRNVSCEVLLAYGWADVYLDIRSGSLRDLISAVTQYRAAEIDDGRPLLRNGFTVVGVDLRRMDAASKHDELVRPTVTLRVSPSALGDVLDNVIPRYFEVDGSRLDVNVDVTTGKRDILVTPAQRLPFHAFWSIHQKLINGLADDFPIQKIETHFQFSQEELAIPRREKRPAVHCPCATNAELHAQRFLQSVEASTELGDLKRSFEGLAHLYVEALKDADSCCDFDAAAGHYFSQYRLIDQYEQLTKAVQASPYDLKLARRWDLHRQAMERLDISSLFIFHQEQNGSYVDLVSRSERVSLFRGGMQKINAVLLSAIHTIIDEYGLPIAPMLCWWPAGHIQSERPTGVIKVPISYLYQPEVALMLIIHELGQLTAYARADEFFPDQRQMRSNILPFDLEKVRRTVRVRRELFAVLEDLSRPEGMLIADIMADAFLLRVGFADDLISTRRFLFEQFIRSEYSRAPRTQSGERYCVHVVARFIFLVVAAQAFVHDRTADEISKSDLELGRDTTIDFLKEALSDDRYELRVRRPQLSDVLRSEETFKEAMRRMDVAKHYMSGVLQSFAPIKPRDLGEPQGLKNVFEGVLADMRAEDIVISFHMLYLAAQRSEDKEAVFNARSALIASALGSQKPRRRLTAVP